MTATPSLHMTALILTASLIVSAPALANGGDFFEELAASWSIDDSNNGVPYFGFVKDARGKVVPEATIMATTGEGSSFVVQSNTMGRYRIPGFAKSVDATKVQITCSKPGYRLVSRDRRTSRGVAKSPVETNCILAPDAAKPAA